MNQKLNTKGRGTTQNPANRFEPLYYEKDDFADIKAETRFFKDTAKSIISYNSSPDISIDAFINPYRGCEHGCVYCYARPFHEYLGLSSGLDFESQIFVKEQAHLLLKKELSKSGWKPQIVGIGGVTDAYQPAERKWQITRKCLQVFNDFLNPIVIITKNQLVLRDIDILRQMAKQKTAAVLFSITSLDNSVVAVMEPRTSRPALKLQAIGELAKEGIPVGVLIGPVIPGLTDHEIPEIIRQAVEAGATYARYILLRLPFGVKELFDNWLTINFPERKNKILNRIRSTRQGNLYNSDYFERHKGSGVFAMQIKSLFEKSCVREGIAETKLNLTIANFGRKFPKQLTLF